MGRPYAWSRPTQINPFSSDERFNIFCERMQRQIWIILINQNNHQPLNVSGGQVACKTFRGAYFNFFADHGISFSSQKIAFKSVKTLSTGFGSSSFCLILIDFYVDISGSWQKWTSGSWSLKLTRAATRVGRTKTFGWNKVIWVRGNKKLGTKKGSEFTWFLRILLSAIGGSKLVWRTSFRIQVKAQRLESNDCRSELGKGSGSDV